MRSSRCRSRCPGRSRELRRPPSTTTSANRACSGSASRPPSRATSSPPTPSSWGAATSRPCVSGRWLRWRRSTPTSRSASRRASVWRRRSGRTCRSWSRVRRCRSWAGCGRSTAGRWGSSSTRTRTSTSSPSCAGRSTRAASCRWSSHPSGESSAPVTTPCPCSARSSRPARSSSTPCSSREPRPRRATRSRARTPVPSTPPVGRRARRSTRAPAARRRGIPPRQGHRCLGSGQRRPRGPGHRQCSRGRRGRGRRRRPGRGPRAARRSPCVGAPHPAGLTSASTDEVLTPAGG